VIRLTTREEQTACGVGWLVAHGWCDDKVRRVRNLSGDDTRVFGAGVSNSRNRDDGSTATGWGYLLPPENKVALGFVEGLHTKIRVLQRRAYGLCDEECLRLEVLSCTLPET